MNHLSNEDLDKLDAGLEKATALRCDIEMFAYACYPDKKRAMQRCAKLLPDTSPKDIDDLLFLVDKFEKAVKDMTLATGTSRRKKSTFYWEDLLKFI